MPSVSCPSCSAHLAKGVLRCRFCGADAREATSMFVAAHASLAELLRGAPRHAQAARRERQRDPHELVAASRELFFGP